MNDKMLNNHAQIEQTVNQEVAQETVNEYLYQGQYIQLAQQKQKYKDEYVAGQECF